MINIDTSDALATLLSDYEVEVAETGTQRQEAYRLRYQVFCLERGILPVPQGHQAEIDAYDAQAWHILLRRRRDGRAIGTARVVPARPGRGRRDLPLEKYCNSGILHALPEFGLGEISRFALSIERRQAGAPGDSLLRLALMQGVLQLSLECGLTDWCALMEPRLIRLMQTTGVRFTALGPLVDACGLRQPCTARISNVLDMGQAERPDYFHYVAQTTRDALASPAEPAAERAPGRVSVTPARLRQPDEDRRAA